MGEYIRDHLPDTLPFFESNGVPLVGRGKWRSGPCIFHGGSDSFRVNVETGGWRCMNCGASGDLVKFVMERDGVDFVTAARTLGAYVDDGRDHRGQQAPAPLPARDAMELAARELLVAVVVISGIRAGKIPSDDDWLRFLDMANSVETLAMEYRT